MATLAENVSAVNDCLTAINSAITTKGGTLQGGQKLRNAAAGILTIETGSSSGNGLPSGCPRIDLVTIPDDEDALYVVEDARFDSQAAFGGYYVSSSGTVEIREVVINNDGSVTETSNYTNAIGSGNQIFTTGGRYVCWRVKPVGTGAYFNGYLRFYYEMRSNATLAIKQAYNPIAIKVRARSNSSSLVDLSIGGNRAWLWCDVYTPYASSVGFANLVPYGSVGSNIYTKLTVNSVGTLILQGQHFACSELKLSGNTGTALCSFCNSTDVIRKVDFSELNCLCTFNGSACFASCPFLTTLLFKEKCGISSSVSLTGAPLLTHDSLVSVIGGLTELASGTTYTLTLSSTQLASLSANEIAVGTGKGWNITA